MNHKGDIIGNFYTDPSPKRMGFFMIKIKLMKEQFEFSITAEQDDGLLPRIILLFTRRKINIDKLQFRATGTRCELVCQLQCMMMPNKAENILKQIENVVAVKSVQLNHQTHNRMMGPKLKNEYEPAYTL